MKLSTTPMNVNNLKDLPSLLRALAPWIAQLSDAINSPQLTMTDNLALQIIQVTFPGARQSVTTSHNLKATPTGYVLIGSNAAVSIYAGTDTTNASQISLAASGAAKVSVLLF